MSKTNSSHISCIFLVLSSCIALLRNYSISFGARHAYVDLGAEKTIAAEKSGQKIAVEIKSFIGPSGITELEKAVGQYAIYRSWLSRTEADRILWLAIDKKAYSNLFEDISGRVILEDYTINLVVIDITIEDIIEWIPISR